LLSKFKPFDAEGEENRKCPACGRVGYWIVEGTNQDGERVITCECGLDVIINSKRIPITMANKTKENIQSESKKLMDMINKAITEFRNNTGTIPEIHQEIIRMVGLDEHMASESIVSISHFYLEVDND